MMDFLCQICGYSFAEPYDDIHPDTGESRCRCPNCVAWMPRDPTLWRTKAFRQCDTCRYDREGAPDLETGYRDWACVHPSGDVENEDETVPCPGWMPRGIRVSADDDGGMDDE